MGYPDRYAFSSSFLEREDIHKERKKDLELGPYGGLLVYLVGEE